MATYEKTIKSSGIANRTTDFELLNNSINIDKFPKWFMGQINIIFEIFFNILHS